MRSERLCSISIPNGEALHTLAIIVSDLGLAQLTKPDPHLYILYSESDMRKDTRQEKRNQYYRCKQVKCQLFYVNQDADL